MLELILYVLLFFLSAYLLMSMRIEKVFKQGRVLEANLMVIILSMCISYLASSFIINLLEVSRIF